MRFAAGIRKNRANISVGNHYFRARTLTLFKRNRSHEKYSPALKYLFREGIFFFFYINVIRFRLRDDEEKGRRQRKV